MILTILAVAACYYRFMVVHDYILYDEIECDPYTDSCFIYCEDDECTEPFYYAQMERPAINLMELCGGYDEDCDAVYACTDAEVDCTVTFCDPDIDGECVSLPEESNFE